MNAPNFFKSISKGILFIILGIVVLVGVFYFIWQKKKYGIVNSKLADTIANKTDSIYLVRYDSIHFDALTGEAYLLHVHIGPDSSVIKNKKLDDLPFLLMDINIASIKISGVKTDKALLAQQMTGDSVVIDRPDINIYFVKKLEKKTKINEEAKTIYDEILGKLDLIQVNHVFINNVNIRGIDYFSKEKQFDIANTNLQLNDVLIDSAHNFDTTRILFCKQIALQMASFISYNNARPAIRVNDIRYSAADNLMSFADINVNRFESDNGDSIKFLHAILLTLKGIDANEIVKNKDLLIDTIDCKNLTINQPRLSDLKNTKDTLHKADDTTGFMHVYSVELKNINFPQITFVPLNKNIKLGNLAFKIDDIKADEVIDLKLHPLQYSKEAEISCDKIAMKSKDGLYNYAFQFLSINTLQKQFKIGSFTIKPFLGEQAFASKVYFQQDRYDVALSGITLKGIDMHSLLDNKLFANELIVDNTSAKIYRDLTKPLNGKSKVGNYPSQLVMKLHIPVNIAKATLSNAFIQYTEHEKISDSSGIVTFTPATLHISNITNVASAIQKNNTLGIAFDTKMFNLIPLKGAFNFFLNSSNGGFTTNATVSKFDLSALNRVSVPMALIHIKAGTINSLDFNFTGDDHGAKGDFAMKYNDMKIDVLKIDKDSKEVSKKGFVSLLANTIVKNDNPGNGNLRTETPSFNRDIQKSFFNLVWKTIFTGMKKTVGIP